MLSAMRIRRSIEKVKDMGLLAGFLAAMAAFVMGTGCDSNSSASAGRNVDLDDALIIIEVNSTDGDAGFQIFLDGEGWRFIRITDPDGEDIFDVEAFGGVDEIGGGTELFLETEEPEYDDIGELQDLVELLPEGEYEFTGITTEGDRLTGEAELTHVVPSGPNILGPAEADILDPVGGILVSWQAVIDTLLPGGAFVPVIDGYQVIVEDEEAGHAFNVTLSGTATEVTVPEEFFDADTLYKFEILAIEESGNQTITESWFCTGPAGPGPGVDPCPEPD
jgi:hypothetical protein